MIKATITSLGDVARNVLQEGAGVVLAVFNSSLYLQCRQSLCCVGTSSLPRGPLNAVSTLQKFGRIAAGDHWQFADNHLTIGNYCVLSVAHTARWVSPTPPEHPVDLQQLQNIAATIHHCLKRHYVPPDKAVAIEIESRINHGEQALQQWLINNSDTPAVFVEQLLGSGDGLTPAGDDLLLGAVVTLKYLQIEPYASLLGNTIVSLCSTRTNQISQAHLCAAASGHANELLYHLLQQCTGNREPNDALLACIAQLLNYGHSSGVYTLRGTAIVLSFVAGLSAGSVSQS